MAALAYGERCAAARARDNVRFAPDARRRGAQEGIASREERNRDLMEARLAEVGSPDLTRRFKAFFDTFFADTEPTDWVEAQAFHYIGDSLVSDFAEQLFDVLDLVSAEIVRHTLGDREAQEGFALEELSRAVQEDPRAGERIAVYARRIVGDALTQTRRAIEQASVLRDLMGGQEGEKRLVLDLLARHRGRLDRLGIERVDADAGE